MSTVQRTVVLATKCYVDGSARERALDSLTSLVGNSIGELEVEFDVTLRDDDFPLVTLTGDDAVVGANLLREEWGEIDGTPGEISAEGQNSEEHSTGQTAVGTLESWDDEGFVLDAGRPVQISAGDLNLGPGDPEQIRTRYGLVQHIPLEFEVSNSPRLSDDQLDQLYDWTRGEGRVNVNSATRAEVRATVNRAGHANDIITVERLGLLEQSIVCKEGTDPPGLLASIGEYLPSELLCVV